MVYKYHDKEKQTVYGEIIVVINIDDVKKNMLWWKRPANRQSYTKQGRGEVIRNGR
jgi:hypothetical protein